MTELGKCRSPTAASLVHLLLLMLLPVKGFWTTNSWNNGKGNMQQQQQQQLGSATTYAFHPFFLFQQMQQQPKSVFQEDPLIIENDIALDMDEAQFRLGLRWDLYPSKRWINNTIPYLISPEYGQREYTLIESALKTFQFLSCLRFEPWDGKQEDYLFIHDSKKKPGCWSYIGRRGGQQALSLRPPDQDSCNCLCDIGRTLHEMMHALGFFHEHSRPDRDKFVTIVKENVKPGKLKNFNKLTVDRVTSEFAYDYDSIMHYGPHFFSSKGKVSGGQTKAQTIEPTKSGARIGQRVMLSKVDCMKVNQQFGCFDPKQPWQNRKIQILCGIMGYSYADDSAGTEDEGGGGDEEF